MGERGEQVPCLFESVELRDLQNRPATNVALSIIKKLLRRGFIFLPEGEHSNVISFTPPLTMTEAQLQSGVEALQQEFNRL